MDPMASGMLFSALAGGCVATVCAWCGFNIVDHRHNSIGHDLNPYSRLLGREVLVKKYQGSEWERCVVICVSWKGAVKVRRLSEMSGKRHGNGFWIGKEQTPTRVREVR